MKKYIFTLTLKPLLVLMFALFIGYSGWGQVNIGAIGTTHTQDFNGLTSVTSVATWTNNSTLPGWYTKTDASSPSSYRGQTGSSATQGLYSFGTTGTTERALGYVPGTTLTGAATSSKGYLGWRFYNNTGKAIGTIEVKWTGEEWKKNVDANVQNIILSYQIGSSVTDLTSGSYISTSSEFSSPIHTSSAAATLDGNLSANRTVDITYLIEDFIPAGSEIMIRFDDLFDSYNHTLAIDDVSFTALKEGQTITFGTLADKTFGDANFGLTATASSGLTVSYSSSNTSVATISGSTVTITGAGSTTISATQTGNATYGPAVKVDRILNVKPQAPTATAATLTDVTSFTANWTAASGSTAYYIYISTDPTVPVPSTYGGSVGNVLSFSQTNLHHNTTYYYKAQGFNSGIYSDYSNIVTVTTGSGVQASYIVATPSFTDVSLTWTNGNLGNRAVFIKEGTGSITNPTDATRYFDGADWSGPGDELGSSGYFCVYYGADNFVDITNLYPGTLYTVQIFEFSGGESDEKYLINVMTDNPQTFTTWGTTTFTNTTPGQAASEDWTTAARWDHATVPTAALHTAVQVYVDGNCVITSAVESNNLTILASHGSVVPKVTINPTKSLTVNNTFTNNNDTMGLRIKSTSAGTGSIIESTTGVKATVERYVPNDQRYHFVSIPVTSAFSAVYLYAWLDRWVETTGRWIYHITSTTLALNKGEGYSLRIVYDSIMVPPSHHPGTVYYRGTLNTGNQTISLTNSVDAGGWRGYNLVGNPYPCGINWDAPSGWTRTNVWGALYFWNPTSNTYDYYINGGGTNTATQYIASQQGFYVYTGTNGSQIQMTNSVKAHNSTAFRSVTDNLLRFKVSKDKMADEALIRFSADASKNFDPDFDAFKLFGPTDYPQIYTFTSDMKNASINCLPEESMDSTKVTLNVKIAVKGSYKITVNGFETFTNLPYLALEDTKTKITQVLTSNPVYSFEADTSDKPGRFIVWFYKKTNSIADLNNDDVTIFSNNKTVFVDLHGLNYNAAEMTITNMLGQTVDKKQITSSHQSSFETDLAAGMYIVRVLVNGKYFDKKLYLEN